MRSLTERFFHLMGITLVIGGLGSIGASPLLASGELTLDFDSVEIATFVKAYGEMTGRNFVLDPRAKGTVTIVSPRPIDSAAAEEVFEAVLRMNGLATVELEGSTKIVPVEGIRSEPLATGEGRRLTETGSGERMITQIVPMAHARPEDARTILQPLVSREGNLAVHPPSGLVILTDRRANVERLLTILRNLDQPGPERRVISLPLSHAPATECAELLQSLLEEGTAGRPAPVVVPDDRTGRLLVLAGPPEQAEIRRILELLDVPAPRQRGLLRVYRLRHGSADIIAETLNQQLHQPNRQRDPVVITAHEPTNAVLVTGPPEVQEAVAGVLAELDVRRPQVFVEAIIVEVDDQRMHQVGLEWRLMDPVSADGIRGIGGTSFPDGGEAGALARTAMDPTSPPAGLAIGAVKGSFTWNGVEILNMGALLQALRTDQSVNILSTPHLMTMDNQEAEIVVGEERPYLKSSQTTDVGSVVRTYEFKDLGLTTRMTPHIGPDNRIRLEIYQELKSFLEEVDIGAVASTMRRARTTVEVVSGRTVVIGGMIREDRITGISRVPCLGSIPALGWLFKTAKGDRRKTNLILFITPTVIRTDEEMEELTDRKRTELDESSQPLPTGAGADARETTALLEK